MDRGHLAQTYARTGTLEEAEKLSLDTIRQVKRSRGAAHPDCVHGLYVLKVNRPKTVDICKLGLQRAEMRISREHPLAKEIETLLAGLEDPLSGITDPAGVEEGQVWNSSSGSGGPA